MKRKILLLPLIYIFILIFASCEQKFTTISGVIWNTSYHIVYRGNQNLEDSIQHELNRVNAGLSMFEPSSTVSLVNAGATDSVGADFIYVFNESLRISAASGGSFDPTVGPLTERRRRRARHCGHIRSAKSRRHRRLPHRRLPGDKEIAGDDLRFLGHSEGLWRRPRG